MRIGMGQVAPPPDPNEGNLPYECNWLEKLFQPAACASAASPVPPIPQPAPPSTSITVGAPDPKMQGPSYTSGQTANGQTIYVNTPSADQIQAAQVQQITDQVAANYVDCSSTWNQLTNSQCPCTICTNYGSWIILGVGALAGLFLLTRIR